MIEATDSGKHRYRCPYCHKVVLCQVNVPSSDPVDKKDVQPQPPVPHRSFPRTMLKKSVQGGKWAGGRIQRFREKYTNADLWLFFIFSILFIVSVIVGLIVCAELAKVIAQGKSWLFRLWLDFKHW